MTSTNVDVHRVLTINGKLVVAKKFVGSKSPLAIVVISPAMAVHQVFYFNFAKYMASLGYIVWTFDYEGIGESLTGPLRQCATNITDWVNDSYESVVQKAVYDDRNLRLFIVGHSLGGQITPLLPSASKLSGLVNVAVGSGSTSHLQPKLRRFSPILWHAITPIVCNIFGYFPGKLLSFIGNVPKGAFLQWKRWCLTPEYLLTGDPNGRSSYAQAKFPVLGLSFKDDELLTELGSTLIHDAYKTNVVDYRVILPSEYGIRRIGHFGFFQSKNSQTLWPLVSDWIEKENTIAN